MTIKDILAHVDDSAAARARFDFALGLARTLGARVTALYLIPELFMSGASRHAPAEVVQEHVALAEEAADTAPVSYTHLTLPTTRLVCRSRWSPYH